MLKPKAEPSRNSLGQQDFLLFMVFLKLRIVFEILRGQLYHGAVSRSTSCFGRALGGLP